MFEYNCPTWSLQTASNKESWDTHFTGWQLSCYERTKSDCKLTCCDVPKTLGALPSVMIKQRTIFKGTFTSMGEENDGHLWKSDNTHTDLCGILCIQTSYSLKEMHTCGHGSRMGTLCWRDYHNRSTTRSSWRLTRALPPSIFILKAKYQFWNLKNLSAWGTIHSLVNGVPQNTFPFQIAITVEFELFRCALSFKKLQNCLIY